MKDERGFPFLKRLILICTNLKKWAEIQCIWEVGLNTKQSE